MPNFIDLKDQSFNRLTVIKRIHRENSKRTYWLCKCQCGKKIIVESYNLKSGNTKSCGCHNQETRVKRLTIHGMSKTRLYWQWQGMIARCENPHHQGYKDYGGRGITVCESWHSFENWYANMGEPPTPQHMIDRIDNNSNYEPNNCKWSTRKEQMNNKRDNHLIEFNGQTKTLKQWSEMTGIPYSTLRSRINKYHWGIEKSLTTPLIVH
jgi:hypothetical protein